MLSEIYENSTRIVSIFILGFLLVIAVIGVILLVLK